jgi:hypothetical protein
VDEELQPLGFVRPWLHREDDAREEFEAEDDVEQNREKLRGSEDELWATMAGGALGCGRMERLEAMLLAFLNRRSFRYAIDLNFDCFTPPRRHSTLPRIGVFKRLKLSFGNMTMTPRLTRKRLSAEAFAFYSYCYSYTNVQGSQLRSQSSRRSWLHSYIHSESSVDCYVTRAFSLVVTVTVMTNHEHTPHRDSDVRFTTTRRKRSSPAVSSLLQYLLIPLMRQVTYSQR